MRALAIAAALLMGCAAQQPVYETEDYWLKPGSTVEEFERTKAFCFQSSGAAYATMAPALAGPALANFQACLRQHGFVLTQRPKQ